MALVLSLIFTVIARWLIRSPVALLILELTTVLML